MEIAITVKYHSDPRTGATKLRATGGGRQATIHFPYELHHSLRYWRAAEELAYRIENKNGCRLRLMRVDIGDDVYSHETFTFEVWDQNGPRFGNHDAVKYDRLPAGYAC